MPLLVPGGALSHDARILEAAARSEGATYSISVTLEHEEAGWDDYADGWRVEHPDGTVLGTRILYHPHVDEQPFTRALSGVAVPSGVTRVLIRARTLKDGWGEETLQLDLR